MLRLLSWLLGLCGGRHTAQPTVCYLCGEEVPSLSSYFQLVSRVYCLAGWSSAVDWRPPPRCLRLPPDGPALRPALPPQAGLRPLRPPAAALA